MSAETLLNDTAGSSGSGGTLDSPAASTAATFAGSNALLTRHQLLRLSCDADISRIALDPDGHVLDLGRTSRTVTPAQRLALIARDRGCIVRGCRRRHTECEAHHLWHWALGGPSDLTNYALVCHLHHHQLHEGGKTLQAPRRTVDHPHRVRRTPTHQDPPPSRNSGTRGGCPCRARGWHVEAVAVGPVRVGP